VLYVRHDGIGDLIMSTGVLRALVERHPSLEVDVLTYPTNAEVLEGLGFIHRLVPFRPGRRWAYPPRVLGWLRRARYDVVIDAMMRRVADGHVYHASVKGSTVMLMLASRAPYRVGMGERPHDFIYSLPVTPGDGSVHPVLYSAAVLVPFGVDPGRADLRPELVVTAGERETAVDRWRGLGDGGGGPRVLVNVSAGNGRRRWPDDRFVGVVRHVRRRVPEAVVAVIGAPDEEGRVAGIAGEAGVPAERTRGIREALALVATADLVLTPDTSVSHAAAALGVAVVVMVPRGGERYVPYGGSAEPVVSPGETLACLDLGPVCTALDAVLQALAGARGGVVRGPGGGDGRRAEPSTL
jgi:ADP-heptose:LPS heptosyltransferase